MVVGRLIEAVPYNIGWQNMMDEEPTHRCLP